MRDIRRNVLPKFIALYGIPCHYIAATLRSYKAGQATAPPIISQGFFFCISKSTSNLCVKSSSGSSSGSVSIIFGIVIRHYEHYTTTFGNFLQFNWLRAVVFQLNLKYLHVKITKPLRVIV